MKNTTILAGITILAILLCAINALAFPTMHDIIESKTESFGDILSAFPWMTFNTSQTLAEKDIIVDARGMAFSAIRDVTQVHHDLSWRLEKSMLCPCGGKRNADYLARIINARLVRKTRIG